MSGPLLELEGLHVSRGGAEVLQGIDLHVAQGEVVTLLGGNGVGKTTSLRTISGLHRPQRGDIRFDGRSIVGRSPREIVKLGIAHVPEGRQVFPGLSVRENLEMGAFVHGGASQEEVARVVTRFPALKDILGRPAGLLSGGQQQMLAIARGLIARPRLLLLDEPTLGLAPIVVESIGAILADLRTTGVTVLLVEQNAALAMKVAARGYVMAAGRIASEGSAEELLAAPAVRRAYLGI
jgi:branched-chain amino acid transport system ATP-binding protein